MLRVCPPPGHPAAVQRVCAALNVWAGISAGRMCGSGDPGKRGKRSVSWEKACLAVSLSVPREIVSHGSLPWLGAGRCVPFSQIICPLSCLWSLSRRAALPLVGWRCRRSHIPLSAPLLGLCSPAASLLPGPLTARDLTPLYLSHVSAGRSSASKQPGSSPRCLQSYSRSLLPP